MTDHVGASFFTKRVRVVENVLLAARTYRIRLEAPEIAAAIRPGQFLMLRMADTSDPGPDCCYDGHSGSECIGGVNMNDDPAAKVCNTTASGAGGDTKGKIVLKAAPDAAEIESLPIAVLGQVSINFVVKVSHASEPVLLSVKKQ